MKIGEKNIIEPNVKIGDNVIIGNNNIIKSGTIIYDNTIIGDNNIFLENNIIGTLPVLANVEYKDNKSKGVVIGNNNFFHISNKISSGYYKKTLIGNYNKFLSEIYISHDCKIGNEITFYPRVFSAGLSIFKNNCNIGAGAYIHQKCIIGSYAMVGMNCTITKNVLPFLISIGSKYTRPNTKFLPKELLNYDNILNNIIKKSNKKEDIKHEVNKLPCCYSKIFYKEYI
jgi:UDP-N-acetylglucosamine acyltransferase